MYNIIISDKDESFVNDLLRTLRVQCPEAKVRGIVGDGTEVLEKIKSQRADIAVLNFDLDGVGGQEILRFIKERSLPVSTIMIADEKNFENAKSAVNYKADGLVLKPVDKRILVSMVKNLEEKTDRLIQSAYDSAENYLLEWEWKRQNLSLVYNGIFPLEVLLKRNKPFWKGRRIGECACCVVELYIKNLPSYINESFKGNEDLFYDAVTGLGEEENSAFAAYQVYSYSGHIVYIVLTKETGRGKAEEFAENLKGSLKSLYSIPCESAVQCYSGIEELLRNNEANKLSSEYLEALSNDNAERAEHISRKIENISDEKQKAALIRAMALMLRDKYDINYSDIIKQSRLWAGGVDNDALLREILTRSSADLSSNRYLVAGIKNYINRNFASEISVASVAAALSMNPSYLGRMFKNETGEKLVDYIFGVRIQKAKDMLSEGKHTVREVALSVGYNQIKYFGVVFKRCTGQTPSEYMKTHMKPNE